MLRKVFPALGEQPQWAVASEMASKLPGVSAESINVQLSRYLSAKPNITPAKLQRWLKRLKVEGHVPSELVIACRWLDELRAGWPEMEVPSSWLVDQIARYPAHRDWVRRKIAGPCRS